MMSSGRLTQEEFEKVVEDRCHIVVTRDPHRIEVAVVIVKKRADACLRKPEQPKTEQ